MTQTPNQNNQVTNQILEFCKHLAGKNKIFALSITNNFNNNIKASNSKKTMQVLMILQNFQPKLLNYPKNLNGNNLIIFQVDKSIFERDVTHGFLGDALASFLLFPYSPQINSNYLNFQQIELKKRLILEQIENLIISLPELSYSLHIEPKYFMYEAMLNRIRIFPPLTYEITNFLYNQAADQEINQVLNGYKKALNILQQNHLISFKEGYVRITDKLIEKYKNPKIPFPNIYKNAPRAIFGSVFGVFPQLLNFFSINTELIFKFPILSAKKIFRPSPTLIDPQKFIYVITSKNQLISLADRVDIKTFVKKFLSKNDYDAIRIDKYGGVLNDVYLITAISNDKSQKILVKQFRNWTSLKWFPISLWSIGTRSFSVFGKSRLERECAINELLAINGFNVPKILHVSPNKGLIFMEFIDGEDVSNSVKRIEHAKKLQDVAKELKLINQAGKIYAKIHELDVVLGDTKPENILVTKQNELYVLDLEQACRDGDKAWDVAEFLYYSGHYLSFESKNKAKAITKAFTTGYLKAGGDIQNIKRVSSPKYMRVFSIFTIPLIIKTISETCKATT